MGVLGSIFLLVVVYERVCESSRGTPSFILTPYLRPSNGGITAVRAVMKKISLHNICPEKQGRRSTTRQLNERLVTYD
jgi:hypothetical protein